MKYYIIDTFDIYALYKYGFEQDEFSGNYMIKYVHGRHTDDRFNEDYITIYVDRTTRQIDLYNDWDDEEIYGLENEIQDLLRDGIVRKE